MLRKTWFHMALLLYLISPACGLVEVPFADGSIGGDPGTGGRANDGGVADGIAGDRAVGGGGGGQVTGGAAGTGGVVVDGADLVLAVDSEIMGIAATDTHVYWIEYGTTDALNNYQFDGVLFQVDVENGEVETVAENLEGPVHIEVTPAEAYIWLDRFATVDPEGSFALRTVSLSTGAVGVITDVNVNAVSSFASFDDHAYFPIRVDGAWSVHEHVPGRTPRQILADDPEFLAADETHLYFKQRRGSTWRISLGEDAAEPELLSTARQYSLALQGDSVVTVTRSGQNGPCFLSTMPKSGGTWTNIVRLDDAIDFFDLAIDGTRYFLRASRPSDRLLTGLTDSSDIQYLPVVESRLRAEVEGAYYFAINFSNDGSVVRGLYRLSLD